MKNILFRSILACISFLFIQTTSFAQAPLCDGATPFCYSTLTPYTSFPSGVSAPVGNNYDCLATQPDPAWFTLTISQSGSISFDIQNTQNADIDFILWGPFPSVDSANFYCGNLGNGGGSGGVVDCSYDPQSIETVDIANAQAGEVYVLMVTNYAGTQTDIFATPNPGSGGLTCDCDVNVSYEMFPALNGNGTMVDTNGNSAAFKVCPQNDTLAFTVHLSGTSPDDSLFRYIPLTTLNNSFSNSFVQQVTYRQDSIDLIVFIVPQPGETGLREFNLGVYKQNRIDTSDCPLTLPIQVYIPTTNAEDAFICSGLNYTASADSFPVILNDTSKFSWTQISGTPLTITGQNTSTPSFQFPITDSTSSLDSFGFEVQMQHGSCLVLDTMYLKYQDIKLDISATLDTVCAGSSTQLAAVLTDTFFNSYTSDCNNYSIQSIPFAPVSTAGTTVAFNDDDEGEASIPIGFDFNFYCNNYNSLDISTNGFISFDPIIFNTFTPDLIPNTSDPNNMIALCWTDLDLFWGGSVTYNTIGTAPNRQLVISFNNVSTFDANADQTAQLILFEGSNAIEIHLTSVTPNGFLGILDDMVVGIENGTGTVGTALPGLNPSNTTITNVSYRLTQNQTAVTTIPTYQWTPSADLNSATIHNPTATPNQDTYYQVTVQDSACTYMDSILIATKSSYPTPTISCYPDSTTQTDLGFIWNDLGLPAGGFYEVSTDNGGTWTSVGADTSVILTGLSSDSTVTLYVRINDGTTNLCPVSIADSISCTTLPCTAGITLDSLENNACANSNTAYINTTVTGINPVTITWSNGATTANISNLVAGTYTISVTDSSACTAIDSFVITSPTALALTGSSSNISCFGDNNGTASVQATGGTGSYNYAWSNSATTNSVNNLAANTYTVVVTDSLACSESLSFTITEPAALAINPTVTPLSCQTTGNTAAIATAATGGSGNYVYTWSNSETTASINNLGAATYYLTITDDSNCTAIDSFVINSTTGLNLQVNVDQGILACDLLPIGAATATAIGGTGITYVWSNGDSTASVNNLDAGTYTVTVSNDQQCRDSFSITIISPLVPNVEAYWGSTVGTDMTSIFIDESMTASIATNQSNLGVNYTWTAIPATGVTLSNTNSNTLTVNGTDNGSYVLIVSGSATTANTTCTNEDSLMLEVMPKFEGLPNAFKPNGTVAENQIFAPITLTAEEVIEFKIFNRFGQMVYNGDDLQNGGWDGTFNGKLQAEDVYIYQLKYQQSGEEIRQLRGQVHLLHSK